MAWKHGEWHKEWHGSMELGMGCVGGECCHRGET